VTGQGRQAGRFIVAEGVEGAGKSSCLRQLAATLEAQGYDVVLTQEPGGTEEGRALRALLLGDYGRIWSGQAELLLMTAARVQHVQRVIAPALAQGRLVLCDRFIGSTIAYQGGGRGLPVSSITALHRDFVGDIQPDLTLLFDVDPRIGLARSRTRLSGEGVDEGRFEAMDLDFHHRVRRSFLDQAAATPGSTAIIDANGDSASVCSQALAEVMQLLERSHYKSFI